MRGARRGCRPGRSTAGDTGWSAGVDTGRRGPAGGGHALVIRLPQAALGSGPAARLRQPRAKADEVVMGLHAQEEEAMDTVR